MAMHLYHISPKYFPKLDLSKVGTSETGSKYCHGIYLGSLAKVKTYIDDFTKVNISEKHIQFKNKTFHQGTYVFDTCEDYFNGVIDEKELKETLPALYADAILNDDYKITHLPILYKVSVPDSEASSLVLNTDIVDESTKNTIAEKIFKQYLMKDESFVNSIKSKMKDLDIDNDFQDLSDISYQISTLIKDKADEKYNLYEESEDEDIDDAIYLEPCNIDEYLERQFRNESESTREDEDVAKAIDDERITDLIECISKRMPDLDAYFSWQDIYDNLTHLRPFEFDNNVELGSIEASQFMSQFTSGFRVESDNEALKDKVEFIIFKQDTLDKIKIKEIPLDSSLDLEKNIGEDESYDF